MGNPNNPTGTVLPGAAPAVLGRACARPRRSALLDQCFRAFDSRAQYDIYALSTAPASSTSSSRTPASCGRRRGQAGVPGVVGERPARPRGGGCGRPAHRPGVLGRVVERFSLDMAAGGLQQLHARIASESRRAARALTGCDLAVPADGPSRVSVSRLRLSGGLTGTRLWGQLLRLGVHSVPCRPFYWSDGRAGDRYLRIALAREPEVVERAARAVRFCVDGAG